MGGVFFLLLFCLRSKIRPSMSLYCLVLIKMTNDTKMSAIMKYGFAWVFCVYLYFSLQLKPKGGLRLRLSVYSIGIIHMLWLIINKWRDDAHALKYLATTDHSKLAKVTWQMYFKIDIVSSSRWTWCYYHHHHHYHYYSHFCANLWMKSIVECRWLWRQWDPTKAEETSCRFWIIHNKAILSETLAVRSLRMSVYIL